MSPPLLDSFVFRPYTGDGFKFILSVCQRLNLKIVDIEAGVLSKYCTSDAFCERSLQKHAFLACRQFVDRLFAIETVEDPPLFFIEIPDRPDFYKTRGFIKRDVGGFAWSPSSKMRPTP